MLDADLAILYAVPTKRLNEQVQRNKKRFPSDFRTVTIAVDTVNPNTIDETVAAGETKYVRVTLAPGRTFQLFPVEVTADEARAALKKCRLVRFIRL